MTTVRSSWIKCGIVGGVLYPLANVLFYSALEVGLGGPEGMMFVADLGIHLFPVVWLHEIIRETGISLEPFEPAWVAVMGLVDFIIGFVIGIVVSLVRGYQKRPRLN